MQTPEAKNTSFSSPHVLILGAGASRAALPNGDRNGLKIPLMKDLPEVCGLYEVDDRLRTIENFEAYFSDLEDEDIKDELERRVLKYFSALKLPPEPTIYDYMVLSMRKKDMIATFNWDPFLYQACERNCRVAEMPAIAYLHGSVCVGHCIKDMTMGRVGTPCSKCGRVFSPPKILFPVKQKDYNSDGAISGHWKGLKSFLQHAYMFTIFGYSAPKTDIEAVSLLKEAWGDPQKRELEEIEIISLSPSEELADKWSGFIHTHHYGVFKSFFHSFVASHPRRSCEAMWETLMQCSPYPENPAPRTNDLKELQDWFRKNLVINE